MGSDGLVFIYYNLLNDLSDSNSQVTEQLLHHKRRGSFDLGNFQKIFREFYYKR